MRYLSFAVGSIFAAFVCAAMPWMSGPYLLDVLGSFICANLLYGLAYLFLLGANAFMDFLSDETKR